ncbi:MAG: hypothetical protein HUJ68_11625 [Clostridia bacterium]|nr:hypothetical protein [Clostridia bacterium]
MSVKNKFNHNNETSILSPDILWCKILAAIDWWPSEHEGKFLQKNEYNLMLNQKPYRYNNQINNLVWLKYIEYIPIRKTSPGYHITELGKQVLQQLKDEFGEDNILIF